MGSGRRERQNSLGHPFLSHTLKPCWQKLKVKSAKSHLQTPGSLWVWTDKQGELQGRISPGNEKYPIWPALQSNCIHSRTGFSASLKVEVCSPDTAKSTQLKESLDFHRESTHGKTSTLGRWVELIFFEYFSEMSHVLTSVTKELT